jgi:hypothetical protein
MLLALLLLFLLLPASPAIGRAGLNLHAMDHHRARALVGRESSQDARKIAHLPAAQAPATRRAHPAMARICAARARHRKTLSQRFYCTQIQH